MQADLFGQPSHYVPDFPKQLDLVTVDDASVLPLVRSVLGPHKGKDQAHGAFWVTMSTFHKELRRSDPTRAFAYARAMKHMQNNSSVKAYLHGICLEETRSLELMRYMRTELKGKSSDKWDEFLRRFLAAAKRWELPFSLESERIMTEARFTLERQAYTAREVERAVQAVETPMEGYQLFLNCLKSDNQRYAFYNAYSRRIPEAVADEIDRWIDNYRFGPNFNVLQSLVDFEFWPETIEDGNTTFDRGEPTFEFDYFAPADYGYDEHNWAGKRRLKVVRDQWGDIFENGQPPGVDMRWCAGQLGCSWRAFAFAKYGERDYRGADVRDPFFDEPDVLRQSCVVQSRSMRDLFIYPHPS